MEAWPSYLAYVVSFLTVGAAWLAHVGLADRLGRVDGGLLRLNLLLLLVVSVLPFPTRLVAEALNDVSGERVFVTMYGLTLVPIRILLFVVDGYCRRAHLYAEASHDDQPVLRSAAPVVAAYGLAVCVGFALPTLAVGLYCLLALYLVFPLRELMQLARPRR